MVFRYNRRSPGARVMMDQALTERIIGAAMKVHSALGPGFLETVYHRALAHALRQAGLKIACGHPVSVHYDGVSVGEFIADILVEDLVLLEIKANQTLVTTNDVQLVNYLTATGIDTGLLLNFGAASLQFRRKFRRVQASDRIDPARPG